jgi:hypothetical protein
VLADLDGSGRVDVLDRCVLRDHGQDVLPAATAPLRIEAEPPAPLGAEPAATAPAAPAEASLVDALAAAPGEPNASPAPEQPAAGAVHDLASPAMEELLARLRSRLFATSQWQRYQQLQALRSRLGLSGR